MIRIAGPRTERREGLLTGVTAAGTHFRLLQDEITGQTKLPWTSQIKLLQIGIIQIHSYLRRPGVYR